MPLIQGGEGTPETHWLNWLSRRQWPQVSAASLLPSGSRLVLVAPHPDDEVLCAGGMLAQWAALGRHLCLVALSDGEASHPGSSLWPPAKLARQRAHESRQALDCLGVDAEVLRLRYVDGGLIECTDRIVEDLIRVCRRHDVLLTTWRGDGHPDHGAAARACLKVSRRIGCRMLEVPVWAWHWARPGDPRLPWRRARFVPLDAVVRRRKHRAMQTFSTQWVADPSTGRPPVLPRSTMRRATRHFEVVFV